MFAVWVRVSWVGACVMLHIPLCLPCRASPGRMGESEHTHSCLRASMRVCLASEGSKDGSTEGQRVCVSGSGTRVSTQSGARGSVIDR